MFDREGFKKEDGWVTVYNYSYENNEYLGSSSEWVVAGSGIPAKSTLITPPEFKDWYARVFSGSEWVQVKDHRGETWYSEDGSEVEIKQLGQEKGLLKDKPVIQKTEEQLKEDSEYEVLSLRLKVDKDITPLQDADELGIATKEELNKLKELKTFRVLLNRWEYPKEVPKYPEV